MNGVSDIKPCQPLTLPCGVTLSNRIAKAAMAENLADPRTNAPNEQHVKLYASWGETKAGLLVTGNVMVDPRYLEAPGNVAVDDDCCLSVLQRWADASQANGSATIVQLSHPGRQCPISITSEPLCPSANPAVKTALPIFRKSRELTVSEIESINICFINTSHIMYRAGFSGIQLDCAHGHLLSQFLSPNINRRDDKFGGNAERRRYLLRGLIKSIRSITSPGFIISVKLNSADFHKGGLTVAESLDVVEMLDGDGIDLLEISGGTYEDAAMITGAPDTEYMGHIDSSESESSVWAVASQEAYFLAYVVALRKRFPELKVPLMLTGGFRTGKGIVSALCSGVVDVIGIARPFATEPETMSILVSEQTPLVDLLTVSFSSPKLGALGLSTLDAGLEKLWHQKQIKRISSGEAPTMSLSVFTCLGTQMLYTYIWNPRKSSTFGYINMSIVCALVVFVVAWFCHQLFLK